MHSPFENQPTPEKIVADLVFLLEVEARGGDQFTGRKRDDGTGRVFGGQAIAQALSAASRTVEEGRAVHSLHAYFLRPGKDSLPIEYRVKRDLDGRSFSNRRVVASQEGQPILNLTASFQRPADGPGHQYPQMPDVPGPDDLTPDSAIRQEIAKFTPEGQIKRLLLRDFPVDFRSVEDRDWVTPQKRPPISHVWFRTVAPLPDDPALHRSVLAYVSDFQILATVLQPFGKNFFGGKVKAASLDHAVWFHEPFRVDEWLLFATEAPWSGGGRGFSRGRIYSRDGRLVATVTQEGMVRHLD